MNTSLTSGLLRVVAAASVSALLLAGCSSAGDGSKAAEATSPAVSSTTTASPGASTVPSEDTDGHREHPSRIVAVTSETADMALLLAGPEAMAAVAVGSQSTEQGMVPDLANQVAETLPHGITPDAEQILSFNPDLVVATIRHGSEQSTADQVASAGVQMVEFPSSSFNSPEAYADALRQMGELTGYPAKAEKYATDLLDAIQEIDAQKKGNSPRVVALMFRGGKIMAFSGDNMVPGLAKRAGAVDAAAEAGITATGPIDAELLVKANPDIIFLEGLRDGDEAQFDELLSNPAVAEVPAVANGNVHLLPTTEASSLAGINLPVGYQKIMDIING